MDKEIKQLKKELARTKKVLGTLITWIAQSSVGVISFNEAQNLLQTLEKP